MVIKFLALLVEFDVSVESDIHDKILQVE